MISSQQLDPWGKVKSGGVANQTTRNFTGQKLDRTGLLYYHARMYDPVLGRFISPDTVIPGTADGKGGSAASLGYDEKVELRPLTVGFHTPNFVATLNKENAFTQTKGIMV